jgi:hypothetical protein
MNFKFSKRGGAKPPVPGDNASRPGGERRGVA